jgi:hypothetical protein
MPSAPQIREISAAAGPPRLHLAREIDDGHSRSQPQAHPDCRQATTAATRGNGTGRQGPRRANSGSDEAAEETGSARSRIGSPPSSERLCWHVPPVSRRKPLRQRRPPALTPPSRVTQRGQDAGMDARPSVPGDGLLHCAAGNLVPEPQRRAVRDQQSAARELPCTCSVLGKRSKQIQPDKRFPALSSCP